LLRMAWFFHVSKVILMSNKMELETVKQEFKASEVPCGFAYTDSFVVTGNRALITAYGFAFNSALDFFAQNEIDSKNTCAVKARGISRIRICEIAKNQSFILERVGCNLSYHFCEVFYLFDKNIIYDIITNLIAGLGGELYSAKDKYQRQ